MKLITNEMIKNFKIMKLGYDFMAYKVCRKESLSFHHLIVPKCECKKNGLGDGYLYWNGAILKQNTSHDYLHLIQKLDDYTFRMITSEMIDMNIKGHLDIENLKNIRQLLLKFEKEHKNDRNKKGILLIKREYIKERIDL